MILIDGVKYELMKPENEEMLEEMVREHSKAIWGENSVYFDKKRLKTASGITSIPDGYVVVFDESPQWYIVEVELSTHQLHNHLSPQISKFSSGISNKAYRDEIIERIYTALENDNELMANIRNKVSPSEVYKFLTGVIKGTPSLAIIIDEKTAELDEVLETNPKNFKEVVAIDFKTYLREGCDLKVHAHFFEPLYAPLSNTYISGKIHINTVDEKLTRQNHRLQGVRKTPNYTYRLPILNALATLGGRASADDVLKVVDKQVGSILNEFDRQQLPSGTDVRWRNAAQWVRFALVKEGLLKSNSPHGVWELSDKGAAEIKKQEHK